VRPLEAGDAAALLVELKVDPKFLREPYELMEVIEGGGAPVSTGLRFFEIDPDLFVSAEMASRVGEI
jgi:hypothetical protein